MRPSRNHVARRWLRIGSRGALAIGAAFSSLAATTGPGGSSQAADEGGRRELPPVVLHVSGGAAGYLESCGCGRNPVGGIPRRAAYVDRSRKTLEQAKHYLLEIGNFSDGADAEGHVKTIGAVAAMNRLEYVASGIGERELSRGRHQVEELLARSRFPFISANLVLASSGQPWLPTSVVVTVGELDVGLTAVTRQHPGPVVPLQGDWVVTRDPVRSLRRHVRELERRSDVLVVLATMPVDEARRAASENPGIDLIVGTHGSFQTGRLMREGRTRIVYLGGLGTHVAQVRILPDPGAGYRLETAIQRLDGSLPPDREMARQIRDVLRRARMARLEERALRRPSQSQRRFVGASACAACHRSIMRDWAETAHSHAFQTLRQRGDHLRSQCLSCHVTGFEQPRGFLDARSSFELAHVGCEACHGPGAQHVEHPERPYGEVSLQTCVACHTNEMDPDFDYYRERPEVSHLGATSEAPGPAERAGGE